MPLVHHVHHRSGGCHRLAQGFHGTLRLLWMFEIGVLGWVETPLAERCGVWKAYGGQPIDVHPPYWMLMMLKLLRMWNPGFVIFPVDFPWRWCWLRVRFRQPCPSRDLSRAGALTGSVILAFDVDSIRFHQIRLGGRLCTSKVGRLCTSDGWSSVHVFVVWFCHCSSVTWFFF